jgi:hypothetical protein
MLKELITDVDKNLLLYQNHNNLYQEYVRKRMNREHVSYQNYMDAEFSQAIPPSLTELNNLINSYNQAKQQNPHHENFYNDKISVTQNKIDNNQYITEDSTEWATKLAFEARKAAFVWPNEEELGIRSQEEQELIAFLE